MCQYLQLTRTAIALRDGTLEFSTGPQGFLDYFNNGNTAALAELCTGLAAS